MERVNSWGRDIKEKFSVSFKKDEEDIKLFLNEQPSPVEYLKVLVRKDMLKDDNNLNNKDNIENKNIEKENNIEINNKPQKLKKENDSEISNEAKEKLMKILNQ